MTMKPVPLNDLRRQSAAFADELSAVLARVAASGWYVLGRELEAFERMFAHYCGTAHCIGVANGTDALELALRAISAQPGDAVITVANAGMYATVAIRAVGATPSFVDIVPATYLMDTDRLPAAISRATKAIIVTHLYGRMVDMRAVLAIAARAGVPVIEDVAQAHGARRDGAHAGTLGAIGCFSFYPTKNLGAIGDGGALVTRDAVLDDRLRRLRQYGWATKYVATIAGGRNSRLDELQAAVLAMKLPRLDEWNRRRREVAAAYSRGITHPGIQTAAPSGEDYVAHLYVVRTRSRDALRTHLHEHGVATDVHYPVPDYAQSPYLLPRAHAELEETERAAAEVLTLPCFPEMTADEVDRVIAACNVWKG